jgi:hypothetical protein
MVISVNNISTFRTHFQFFYYSTAGTSSVQICPVSSSNMTVVVVLNSTSHHHLTIEDSTEYSKYNCEIADTCSIFHRFSGQSCTCRLCLMSAPSYCGVSRASRAEEALPVGKLLGLGQSVQFNEHFCVYAAYF